MEIPRIHPAIPIVVALALAVILLDVPLAAIPILIVVGVLYGWLWERA